MKHLIYSFYFLLFSLAINAQPIITSSDMPREQDVFNYKYAKLAGTTIGTTGMNQIWDYSNLQDTTFTDIDSSISVASAPNNSLFPASNFVLHSVSTNPGLVSSLYSYQIKTPTTFKTSGWVIPGANVFFRTPMTAIVTYPFTYGNTNTDSSIVVYMYNGVTDSITWKDYISAVGYGTLKLPGSRVYNNVLLVRRETTQRNRFGTTTKKVNHLYFTPGVSGSLMSMEITSGSPALLRYLSFYSSLPLQWLGFTASNTNGIVKLNWKTANEVNTKSFYIERSANGVEFSTITKMSASGKSVVQNNYQFSDNQPFKGNNYYRIKSVDADGQISYSKTIHLLISQKDVELNVFPTVVSNQLMVHFYSSTSQKLDMQIINSEGKVASKESRYLIEGNSNLTFNVAGLSKGAYSIVCYVANKTYNATFVKQ